MLRSLETIVAESRTADSRALEALENELAAAVRVALLGELRRARIVGDDADDAAQDKVLKLVRILLAGATAPGSERAYVERTAQRAAADFFRRRKRRREVELFDESVGDEAPRELVKEPPGLGADAVSARQAADHLGELLRPGSKMPDAYRAAIAAIHGHPPISIETLAAEELARSPRSRDGTARTIKQARNVVDQRLTRARKWLQDELASAGHVLGETEEEP